MITGKTYDFLKFCALVAFPSLGTFYFALAGIWGFPAAEQVVGTIVAVDAFLGVILQISSTKYASSDAQFDGDVHVSTDGQGRYVYSLELNDDPELTTIEEKDKLVFKVHPEVKKMPARKPAHRRR